MYTCDVCKEHGCKTGDVAKFPGNCPCRKETLQNDVKELYNEEENHKIAYNSALVEAEGYGVKTRLEEIMEFANKCGYKKLGIGFCIGLANEAAILGKIFRHNGFEVNSVVCKNGSIPKESMGIKEEQKVRPCTYEPMCNPIGQAKLLNKSHTDLNILLGLCVGHDSLFIKYSEAPVTVFAVKDRVLGHNPLAALYTAESYYKKKLFK